MVITLIVDGSLQPEMEMVAWGLEKHLKLEQRKHLMDVFSQVCDEGSHRIAREALGLVRFCFLMFDMKSPYNCLDLVITICEYGNRSEGLFYNWGLQG